MGEVRFCPYCGKHVDLNLAPVDHWKNICCSRCGMIVSMSDEGYKKFYEERRHQSAVEDSPSGREFQDIERERQERIEQLEEYQEASGFNAQQDLLEMRRRER